MSDVAFRIALPIGGLSCLNISKTNGASNFKIYRNVALDGLFIATGNDVIIYFLSTVNHINVFIFGHVRSRFLSNGSIDFIEPYRFGKGNSRPSFLVFVTQ